MIKLRYWLIRKLSGADIIVLNAKIKGCIETKFSNQSGYIANNKITYPKMDTEEYELQSEYNRLKVKLGEERRLLGEFPIILKERLDVIKKKLGQLEEHKNG